MSISEFLMRAGRSSGAGVAQRSEHKAGTGSEPSPPHCITGGKSTEAADRAVSVDWMTLSGPRSRLAEAVGVLRERFGPGLPGGALRNLKCSYQWGGGLGVWFDPHAMLGAQYIVVQVPGQALAEVGPDEQVRILRDLLGLGFKSTRLDVAVDHHNGVASDLIDRLERACDRGCLVKAKIHNRVTAKARGEWTHDQLNIGRRGKDGSGRYVRIYDKGLETKTEERGQWVRYEVEFSGDCAKQVAESMVLDLDPMRRALELAFSAFDLRYAPATAGERVNASRRARLRWWGAFIAGVETAKVVATRTKTTLESYSKWFATSVAPTLKTYARAVEQTPEKLFTWLAGDREYSDNAIRGDVFRQVCKAFGVSPGRGYSNACPRAVLAELMR